MSGIFGQFGFAAESTWGTAVTAATFHEGFLNESIKNQIARIESNGIRAGRMTTSKWKPGAITVGGSLTLELWSQPMATLLEHMFGTLATTGAGPYVHTASPGSLWGKSMTIQFGRPAFDGQTVHPFTYSGAKIASWTLNGAVGDTPDTVELEFSCKDETTGTALEAASYGSGDLFTFVEGSLSIAGTAVATISEMSLSGDNGLDVERHRIGGANIREQQQNGMREFTGSLTGDFESLDAYNRYVNGTEAALVMNFGDGTNSLEITSNVRFDGETPEVAGVESLTQNLPFKCLSGTSDADAITAVLSNSEATA